MLTTGPASGARDVLLVAAGHGRNDHGPRRKFLVVSLNWLLCFVPIDYRVEDTVQQEAQDGVLRQCGVRIRPRDQAIDSS